MKRIAYIVPTVHVKSVTPLTLMQGSLNPDNPISGLDPENPIGDGGDNPGDFAKTGSDFDIWEDQLRRDKITM